MSVGRVTRRAKEVFISKSVRPYRVSASTVVTLHYCCHPCAFENDGLSEPTFTVFATLVQLRAGPCFAALHMSALGVRSCKFPFSSKLVTPAGKFPGEGIYPSQRRTGWGAPLGSWGLLFTPQAMVIAQMILVALIVAALTRRTIEA